MKGFVRKEIGSEFWDVPVAETENDLFPGDTRWFVSGTGALEYIIRDIQAAGAFKCVGVPSWCCSCMIQPFADAGITVVFYPVYLDSDRRLTCDYSAVSGCDATLVLSYFGYEGMRTLGQPGGIRIRDLTHSLFSGAREDAQYCFGSLRKWAGFWTGGYAWKQGAWRDAVPVPPPDAEYLRCRNAAMSMKQDYLKGNTHRKDYLAMYEAGEDFLDRCGIMGSCDRDISLARRLDAAGIRTRRRENARILLEELRDAAIFPELGEHDCPMFVPIVLPDRESRDGLRRFLIENEMYCPVHWPVSELHVLGEKERCLYERGLSIVCDQRYEAEDMMRIVDALRAYRK